MTGARPPPDGADVPVRGGVDDGHGAYARRQPVAAEPRHEGHGDRVLDERDVGAERGVAVADVRTPAVHGEQAYLVEPDSGSARETPLAARLLG